MNRNYFVFSILLILVLSLPVLGSAEEKIAPTWCKKCNKTISEANRKYAVTVTEGLEPSAFDDIGCSLLWRDGECAMRTSAFDSNARVYDYATGEPVVVENAFFAYGPEIKSPLGYGIAAFKTRGQAEKSAAQLGKAQVMTFQELVSLKLK